MTRRTYLLAVLGAPTLSPAKVKKVVADLSEQTLTTTYESNVMGTSRDMSTILWGQGSGKHKLLWDTKK